MDYIQYCSDLFNIFNKINTSVALRNYIEPLSIKKQKNLVVTNLGELFLEKIEKSGIKIDKIVDIKKKLKYYFMQEIQAVIYNNLRFFQADLNKILKLDEISYYIDTMSVHTCFLLFWIWYNKIKLPKKKLIKIVQSIFLGTAGYKLIDIYNDTNTIGKESIVLGYQLIHLHELYYLEIFDSIEAFKIINKYYLMYSEVEYLEKKMIWKPCPFDWNNIEKIGLKAAPLFSIYELLLRYNKKENSVIEKIIQSLIYIAAATQIMDDIGDAEADLNNGIETLSLSGFFNQFNNKKHVNKNSITKFFNSKSNKGISFIYKETLKLIEKSRKILTECDDDLLLLLVELNNRKFNNIFDQLIIFHEGDEKNV